MKTILSTAERFRRHQRDLRAYRQRSLFRRSHARFRADLAVLPHIFLAPHRAYAAPLRQTREQVIKALRGRSVWTLDTASRLACEVGFLSVRDLTGYFDSGVLTWLADQDLIEEPQPSNVSIAPVLRRPSMLIVHIAIEPPSFVTLPSGDLVVSWEFLMRDIKGTLGWRPDLLTRLEDAYCQAVCRAASAAGPLERHSCGPL